MKTTFKTFENSKGKTTFLIALVSSLFLSFTANGQKDGLQLSVNNVKENGILRVSFCTSEKEWTENGKYILKFNVVKGEDNIFNITSIPKGLYAIALYQDINNNGELDTNFLGIPKEPYAFSNNKKPGLSAPSFDKCSFDFSENNQLVSVTLLD